MHHVAVVGSDALFVALGVADNVLLGETILLAEVGTKFNGLTVHLLEIGAVRETVLADFKTDMGVVGTATGVPSTVIPRQGLVCGNRAVSQFADESVDADLSAAGVIGIPVIAVLVFTEQTVIGTNVSPKVGVVRSSGMNHDALDGDGSASLVAGIFRKVKFMQIHRSCPLCRAAAPEPPSAFQGSAVPDGQSFPEY